MVITRAIVGAAMLLASVAEAAPQVVPMVIVDPPPAFDTARFATSLETYVTNAAVVIETYPPGTDELACTTALSVARAAKSPVALWARWTSGAMTVSLVFADKGCAAAESSAVDVPPDQPDFVYRVAALKVASLLRVLPEAAPEPHVEPPPVEPPRGVPAKPVLTSPPDILAIDAGAMGVISTEGAARTYALVATTWYGRRFLLGGGVLASAAHDADAAGGSGSARVFGLFAGVRKELWDGPISVVHEIDIGVQSVWASADRVTGADAMSERVWTPFLSLAPHVRIHVAGPLHVTVGPTLDVAREIDIRVGEVQLYHAGVLRFRWDARAQIWF